ncbi:Recombination protein RecR [Desulfurella amilsii]|uniref:Recombination protein RecR n=1 Tax=Desulfurella amilsii TaxID=1562698 RepID=A0A1X4XUQ9_9BACT|nr:recombination mediator RecR [Desulfurella amilsii]OSS41273.1 Recombination protein RecR [Desulfurella amilsii]
MIKSIENLVESITKLPGIGQKSALRYALWLINNPQDAKEISKSIETALHLKKCKICANLCESDICDICLDENRDKSTICVVETIETLLNLEPQHIYNGVYFVLWGLISPIEGIYANDLGLEKLKENAALANEIILMLDDSIEGNLTAQYIIEMLPKDIKITKPASGIPVGYNIDSLDKLTLQKAFQNRVPY